MSSNCDRMEGCGKTFSISDLTVYCGRFCLMVRSMLVICCKSEPSSPERPGGVYPSLGSGPYMGERL